MKAVALPLVACLAACQGPTPAVRTGSTESAGALILSGRLLGDGVHQYGELLAQRTGSPAHLQTAVVYRSGGQSDPRTGEPAAVIVSGVELKCDTRLMRYTYHSGYRADGRLLYRFAVPDDIRPAPNERMAKDLCDAPEVSPQPEFEGAADFLRRTVNGPAPIPSIVMVN